MTESCGKDKEPSLQKGYQFLEGDDCTRVTTSCYSDVTPPTSQNRFSAGIIHRLTVQRSVGAESLSLTEIKLREDDVEARNVKWEQPAQAIGAVGNRQFLTPPSVEAIFLAKYERWACGEIRHASVASSEAISYTRYLQQPSRLGSEKIFSESATEIKLRCSKDEREFNSGIALAAYKMMRTTHLLVVAACLAMAAAHSYHLGNCPVVEPMPGFEMSKFLGVWYAIQKTSTASRCVTYNFTLGEDPGEYILDQVSEHPVLGVASVDNKYHYTGQLKASADVPAKMTVKFPLSIAGSASFIVFMTDYDSYAGIYSCQKLPAANRRSATILSRTKTMDKIVIDKIRSRMSNFGVNPYDLSIIDQSKCPTDPNFTFNINKDTFSSHNIAGVVRKAGEKLGDGVEYAAEGVGKIYNHVKKDSTENKSDGMP